jgi:hypothetical protein
VGTLTVTGTAADKRSVAAFADSLSTVPGLTAPLISNVQGDTHGVNYTINLVITTAAFGGRYYTQLAPAQSTAGGK